MSSTAAAPPIPEDPEARSTRLSGPAFWAAFVLASCGLMLTVNQVFNLGLGGFRPISTAYYYLIIGFFGAFAFLAFPAVKAHKARVPWFDWILAAATLGLGIWLATEALRIQLAGWNATAPDWAAWLALALLVLILDGVRRTGEIVLFFACLIFGVFPIVADSAPGFLWGVQFSPLDTVREHVFGTESIIGIPMQVVSDTLIGFLVFGVVLSATGGAAFFMDFALALMGTSRGGPAKVAVVSSATFGMLSGSPTSNVLTTGTLTIPTMKRCGYAPHYAGAVEACASTGGALMPPVMGAAAFIMANFLNVPYAEVMVAAVLPSLLYYGALFLQTDLYAVRNGLRGVPRSEVPPLLPTLASGWYYIASIVGLTVLLLAFRIEAEAPFWVCLFLLVVAVLRARSTGFDLRRFCGLVVDSGQAVAQLVALIAGIGLIIGSLSITGVANSFSRELVQYAAGNVALLLFFGAVTSFILGMGMTASACYIFLAIVLAPALVQAGLDPMASHLYVLYWGIVSFITPPVALAAIAAASIAKSSPMVTGLMALRIGILLMLLPVLFVLQPALILRGDLVTILQSVLTASVAVVLIASAFEGYVYKVGATPLWARLPIGAGGLLMLIPEATTDIIGLAIGAASIAALAVTRGRAAA
ncbi:TRAP transporter fused permease subunit [Roseomonas alkaliterrae]|uniref:TRAP transporter 4TM/12TM fusion protein n=1 Tax=Neoroseomonas alkaliterrae TaxID=1452450 RepID=A0A840Y4B2_9PROT|nr:TRAP transporter fused permease subunit [Neoroseomonas alkaliterrae]MBB5688724.1 TRAP transporter 4TM/12TM fusion protein [Neoroseomonas alkaliterrae]MBR0676850.1 TRAP transporter fused permease subunit [Neoroseomonas alkaliterrae]